MFNGRAIKCVVLGDRSVGKTSLIATYLNNKYDPNLDLKVSCNYEVTVTMGSKPFILQICDSAGYKNYQNSDVTTYEKTNVFLLCFSVVNPKSFESIKEKWLPDIKEHLLDVSIILVGTQMDLRQDPKTLNSLMRKKQKPVFTEMAENLAKDLNAKEYIECSALTQKGVQQVFDMMIMAAFEKIKIKKKSCQLL